MSSQVDVQTMGREHSGELDARWKGLWLWSGILAFTMLGFMVVQIVVYSVWPPPTTVESLFDLFNRSWFLGLLSLDLIYLADSAILIVIYLGLYAALRSRHEAAMLVAVVLGLVGVASYFSSNTAFEMLALSRQFAAAGSEVQRQMILTAGHVMMGTYTGTAFDVYYVLNTVVLFIVSPVMLRTSVFSRTSAYLGLAAGVLMVVPSSAGTLGLYFSLASLIPWAVWLVLVGRTFLRISRLS